MTYKVYVTSEVQDFFSYLDEKTARILKNHLKKLGENPYPSKGAGDKEHLPVQGKLRFRMHVGRTWTIFYSILEKKKQVRVVEIIPIDQAHKKYGY